MSVAYAETAAAPVPVPNTLAMPGQADEFVHYTGQVSMHGIETSYHVTQAAGAPELDSARPLVITPGYLGIESAYRPMADALTRQGHTVVTMNPSRGPGWNHLNPHQLLHPGRLLSQAATAVIDDIHERYETSRFCLVGHSMGGVADVEVAEAKNGADGEIGIEAMILLQAAGVTRHTAGSLLRQAPALRPEAIEFYRRNPGMKAQTVQYIRANPALTISEGIAAGYSRLSPWRLARLGRLGVATGAIYHDNDPLFPAAEAAKMIGGAVNVFLFGAPEEAGHLAPWLYPEQAAEDCTNALQILDMKLQPGTTARNVSYL